MGNWERFNKRSDKYEKYRPRYPDELLELLKKETGLNTSSAVADVGSGTGILSELIIRAGCKLFCVEPNEEMRRVAFQKFEGFENCEIIDGTAERTTLPDASVDIIVVGQAFHWFDPLESRREFGRILKQGGYVALVWNTRIEVTEGMNFEYERMVKKYSPGYRESGSRTLERGSIDRFFNGNYRLFKLTNGQTLDLEGLMGRYLSSSYAIDEKNANFNYLKSDLSRAFSKFEKDGHVTLKYETEVFLGGID